MWILLEFGNNPTEFLLEFNWKSAEIRKKFKRSFSEDLPQYCRNSIRMHSILILSKFNRDSIEILSKLNWNYIEILTKSYWNPIENLSKFYRNSIAMRYRPNTPHKSRGCIRNMHDSETRVSILSQFYSTDLLRINRNSDEIQSLCKTGKIIIGKRRRISRKPEKIT